MINFREAFLMAVAWTYIVQPGSSSTAQKIGGVLVFLGTYYVLDVGSGIVGRWAERRRNDRAQRPKIYTPPITRRKK